MFVTVTPDAIPATVAGGELPRVGHRVRAPLFTSWTTSKLLVPSPSSFLLLSARRAKLERAAPSNRRRSSHRRVLAAATRFVALRTTTPRPEARPSLHEHGRALPRSNRPSTELRPPLAIIVPAELRPSPSSSLSEVSSAQNRPTVSSAATLSHSPTLSLP